MEGECSALDNALRNLRDLSKLFGMVPLLRESIACPVSQSVAVGINRFVDHITEHLPPEVQVFHLCAEEIIRRTEPGAARDLLIGFI